MKKVVIAVTAALIAAAAPSIPAHAVEEGYRGGCSVGSAALAVPGEPLGGQNSHTGVMVLGVVATTDGVPDAGFIAASCDVYINGVYIGEVVSAAGTGAAAGVARFNYWADIDVDVVTVCENVDRGAGERIVRCVDTTNTPIVPQPVVDALWTVGGVVAPILMGGLDPIVCPHLVGLSPGVPGLLDIEPDGDVLIRGGLLRDCPPYETF